MMEGGGEGVVAVVRWLSDAGLAVGLLSSTQPWRPVVERVLRESSGRASSRRVRCEQRASQTFPGREHEHATCPEPYASTYQVTHCGVGASSPAHWHTEFPPQRRTPSPALGNFEVGHRSGSPAHSDVYNRRVDKDTGWQYRPKQDRDVDAFVSSLRKYPSVTERTTSTELLERILKTSRTLSPKESPPPSKKRRHHWDKPQPLAPLSLYANRHRDRGHRKPDQAQSDPRQKTYGPEKYPLPGPVSITAFDYLNSGKSSPKIPEKKLENRHVKNAFREAHRQKRPVTAFPICPVLQSRYEKHLKQCHPTTSKALHEEFMSSDECSKCLLKKPCLCEAAKGQRRVVDKKEQEKRALEDAIFTWLKDIPIYPNEKPHDKFIRDAIVKKLAETLSGMPDSQFAIEGKEEIEKALKKMPMWYPTDQREREHFINMITDSLIEKIKSIKEMKSFNEAAEDFLDEITFGKEINREQVMSNIITELNKIALNRPEDDSTYRDLLKMKAFELLDPLPIKTFGNKYEYLNELSDGLAEHLVNPHLDQETKQTIKEDIKDILDHSHAYIKKRDKVEESLRKLVADIVIKGMDDDKAESLIRCLLDRNVPDDKIEAIKTRILAMADKVQPIHSKLSKQTKQMIKDYVRDMIDISDVQFTNRPKIEEGLQKIVHDVATKGIDEDKAVDFIKSLLKGKVPEDKHDDFVDQILELINQLQHIQLDQGTRDMLKGEIRNILDISGAPIKGREKLENSLLKFVNDLVTKGVDENEAVGLIKAILKGKVPEHKHEHITDQIMELADQIKPRKLGKETKEMIKADIRDILDVSGAPIKNREKVEKALQKFVHDAAITGMDEEEAEALIKSLLKGKVAGQSYEDITNQILELANQVKPLDMETKQMIKGDIRDILDTSGAKITDRDKIEKTLNAIIHDVATTGMDEDKAEDLIKSLLKGKVSVDKFNEITDQMIELANQVKRIQVQPLDKETKQMIKGDIRDILNTSGAKIKDREIIEKTLKSIVHDVATTGMDEDKAEALIKSLLKGKVPENKHDDITNQILELANQVKPLEVQPLDKETQQMIKGDIREALDLSGAKIKDREKIEKTLNTIVRDVATTGMNESKAEATIKSLLKGKVSEDKHDDIIDKILSLANQVKPSQAQPVDKETKQIIKGDIRDILDTTEVPIKNREIMEKTLNTIVHDVVSKGLDEDKVEAMVKSLLKGKVSEDKHDEITDQILSLVSQVKPIQVQPLDKETKQMIKDDIHDVLDISGAKIKDREFIAKTLNSIVHDVAATGMDEDKAEALIQSLLKGKVPENKHDDITNKILELANQIKPPEVQPLDKETKQMIKGDIRDVLDLSGAKIKDSEKIEKALNTIVRNVATTGMDESKAEAMIKSLLKGKVSEDKHDDIIDKILSLANQVKPSQAQPVDKETKQIIKGDIRDILDTTGVPNKNREKIEKTLNTIVHDVVSKGLDEDKVEAMVKSLLKGKVSEDKHDEITDQILSLVSQVKPIQVQPLDKETKQMIKDDIHDVLDISGAKIKDREFIAKTLNSIVHDVATTGMDEDKAEALIQSLLKGKVPENKHDDITNKILELANQIKPPEVQPLDKETKQMIKGDIRDVLDFSSAKIKDSEKIEKSLNTIVRNVATTGMDESKAEAMIKSLLKGKVSEDKHDDIIDKILSLANQVKPSQAQPVDKETKQIIKGDIRDILDTTGVPNKNREKIEKTLNTIVHDVVSKGLDEDKVEAMVKSLLKGKVSEDKHDEITDQILSLVSQVKPIQVQPLDKETKQMIKDDIHDVLDISGAKIKDREFIEKTLNSIVHDVATTGMDEDKAEALIQSLLKGKVPENKHDDITNQILELANQVKPPEVQPLDKETKQMIKGDIRDVLDFSGAKIKDSEKIEKALNTIVRNVATTGMDESKAEAMIKSLLKGKVSEDKHDDIIDKILSLANQVKPSQAQPVDKETKQIIKGDIRDILDTTEVPIKNREIMEKTLNTIVHDVVSKGLDEDKVEAMVKSLLKGKVSEDKHDEITDQILSLVSQVKPIQVQPLDKETKQMIKDDIHDVLDISGAKIKDREFIAKTLNSIVHDVATTGMDEDKAEALIKSLLKGKVPENKHDDITNKILELANQIKPPEVQPLDKETQQMIKGDIREALDLSGAKIKDREKIEKTLNTIVRDVATTGMNESKAEATIKSLLKGKVSEEKHDDIIDQILTLANQVKPIQIQPLNKETKQMIKDDIHEVLDIPGEKIKDREKIEKSLNTIVHDVATKGIDEDKVKAMVKSLLKGKVSEDKHDDIIDQILSLANQVKPSSSKPLDLETNQIMKKDITDILDVSKSHIKNRSQVEENVRNLISSMLSTSIGKDKAKSRLKSILKRKVSDDEVEDISSKFLELANKIKATQTMHDPKFQEALKNDITDILLETDAPIKNRSNVEESLRDILSDIVMRGMDKSKAQDYIHSALKGNVSDSQSKEISKKILALAEQRSLSLSLDSSGPLASSTQNEQKIYYDQVYGSTRDWLKNMNIALKDRQIDKVAETIANETLDRQKYLQLNPGVKILEKKESEILKEQIYKALNKLVDKKMVQSIMTNADDLIHSLKEIPPLLDSSKGLVQDSIEFVQENLEGALLNWLRGSPIYQSRYPNNKESQEQMMLKLAKTLAAVLSSPANRGAKPDEALLKEIIKQLEELPLEPQFKSKDYIRELGGHLLDYLKSLQLFQDISARGSLKDSHRTNTSLMPTTNHLNDIVNDWCVAIPLPSTDESFRIQQDLANKIILKIGEMNMNQDIFNDDSLYEEVLQDFVDQQANSLEISQYVTEDHKRVLIEQIKQVKQKVQDDMVGRAYKQQLRDTVSDTLPSILCPTVEDLASFELMKENLADAFINLNYSGEDEEVRAKYKRKLIDEVNKYVNDYLRRCPAPPVNAKKLNEDLYKALINVPLPGDESMRSEVETVRMKDVINDWLKTIPMNKQSKAELLRTNKIITLMGQKLQELETEFHPEFEDTAVEEIVTYLKKLPLKNKNNLDEIAKKLVEKIKNTAESRAFVEGTRSKLADDCLCKDLPVPPLPAWASNQSCVSFIPPCGLSKEDQELLQKIRERSLLCETATQSRNRKDAAVNPPPSDRGSQTKMPCQSKFCQHVDRSESVCSKFLSPSCQLAEKSEPICSRFFNPKTKRVPVSTRPCTTTGSQADVSPFVLVKEYYWDSPSGNKVEFATQTPGEESGRICIPSSPVSPEGICRSRECITRRPIRPRSHLDASSCRRATPRRQFTSACPNEYFSRPKPHNCLKSRPVPERDYLRSQCRRVGANRPRGKSSCQSCQDPTRMCPDCFPMHVCPHPTCLYFK